MYDLDGDWRQDDFLLARGLATGILLDIGHGKERTPRVRPAGCLLNRSGTTPSQSASAGQSARCLPMLSREQPQAPLRYPEPSRVRSPRLLSERLCRLEERREPCPCKRENHKFSDLWRPKMHVVQYFIWLSRRSAAAMSVAD